MTIPSPIARTVQQTQEWLKELRDNADFETETAALSVLRVVLHQLRDRLTPDEAVQLGAQLPTVLRGVYYEGWRPARTPERIRSKEQFLDAIETKLLPRALPVERVVRDVFALLAHHCDPGEISQVIDQLPSGLKGLWPEHAVTYRARV
ncbi:MAG TPA: DUF2267 domain-containing protein [Hyphomicrobium sp.]|nr:DUF2267 domain-containing protein [Hyphomicrobium sp.]